jgi:hypothetical protein
VRPLVHLAGFGTKEFLAEESRRKEEEGGGISGALEMGGAGEQRGMAVGVERGSVFWAMKEIRGHEKCKMREHLGQP